MELPMNDLKFASRWLAAVIIAQLVLGPFINFALLEPVFRGQGGFLANAAPNATALVLGGAAVDRARIDLLRASRSCCGPCCGRSANAWRSQSPCSAQRTWPSRAWNT